MCACDDQSKLYIEAVKQTNKQEQHANGPLSAGMTDTLCVRVGMEGLLCERNRRGRGFVEGGVTLTMVGIVYQSPSSINQDDPALIGVLVKLVSRPPFPPLA